MNIEKLNTLLVGTLLGFTGTYYSYHYLQNVILKFEKPTCFVIVSIKIYSS